MSSNLQNLGKHAVVVFGKVTLNSGSAYDGNTGIFTAPTDGIYSFTWTILTTPGSLFHTEIVINGNLIGYNHAKWLQNLQIRRVCELMATHIIETFNRDTVLAKVIQVVLLDIL